MIAWSDSKKVFQKVHHHEKVDLAKLMLSQ